mmetsp:Transcript_142988/g.362919  ORF Transcript_142988/g.362919 Transcript_142988/m.362919 type:complete len:261 (-) Transcript_142988:345-1127(-)
MGKDSATTYVFVGARPLDEQCVLLLVEAPDRLVEVLLPDAGPRELPEFPVAELPASAATHTPLHVLAQAVDDGVRLRLSLADRLIRKLLLKVCSGLEDIDDVLHVAEQDGAPQFSPRPSLAEPNESLQQSRGHRDLAGSLVVISLPLQVELPDPVARSFAKTRMGELLGIADVRCQQLLRQRSTRRHLRAPLPQRPPARPPLGVRGVGPVANRRGSGGALVSKNCPCSLHATPDDVSGESGILMRIAFIPHQVDDVEAAE